jgi:transcriptional regulator with XRE-family HTH domain
MKDTVLDLLAPKEEAGSFEGLSLYSAAQNHNLTKTDALELANKVLGVIEEGADSRKLLNYFSLMHIAKRTSYYYDSDVLEGMALAIDYYLNPSPESLNKIQEITIQARDKLTKTAARDELNDRFSTAELAINYLSDYFGDDLIEELVELTGVSKATVKRYQSGNNPRRTTHDLLTRLAKTFYLLSETKTKEQVIDFYKNEIILDTSGLGPTSLRNYLIQYHNFSYSISGALKNKYGWTDIY